MSLGIIGLGRLGSLVAAYGRAFGMKVYYYSPYSTNDAYIRCNTLIELANSVNIVSVHANHTCDTEKLLDREFFQAMKPGGFFVNTARGELVNEVALLEALESGKLGGAALDMLRGEFKPGFSKRLKSHKLIEYANTHENLIITPHYAGATLDAWDKTQTKTIELILEALKSSVSFRSQKTRKIPC